MAAIYLTAFPYHSGLRSPNELCRLWQARALVDHRTIELGPTMRELGPVGDLSVKDGRYFPSKAPLLSFLAAPVYAALKAVGAAGEVSQVFWSRLWLTVLPTLALLFWVRRFLLAHVSAAVAEALTATYALGSLALSYSLLFMSHQAAAVLLFSAFYSLWRVRRKEWGERGYLLAGAAAGAAIAAEYTAALGVAVLALYGALGARPRLLRAALLATLGALPFIAFLAGYHQAAFGHPLHSGYQYLADAAYQPWHLGGFLGIRYPDPRAFILSFFSPLRGLFALSPFLLLALPGLGRMWRQGELRALFFLSALMLAGYAYFTSSFSYESWGWTTGPRHLTGLVPFLLLPAALFLERVRQGSSWEEQIGLGLCAALCAGSVMVTGAASLVNYVPDVVSSVMFGLAVPLFRDGYLPPTAMQLFGLQSPLPGALLLLGLGAAAVWVVRKLLGGSRPWAPSLLACALALSVYLGLLGVSARGDAGDLGAQAHLKSVWSAPRLTP